MNDRIVPLADVPAPSQPPEAAPALAEGSFSPDPLNTLEVSASSRRGGLEGIRPGNSGEHLRAGSGVQPSRSTPTANVQVRMTLTAPACPAAQTIPIEVERRIREVAGVNEVKVQIVWDPPWTREKMSEAAKLSLGMY